MSEIQDQLLKETLNELHLDSENFVKEVSDIRNKSQNVKAFKDELKKLGDNAELANANKIAEKTQASYVKLWKILDKAIAGIGDAGNTYSQKNEAEKSVVETAQKAAENALAELKRIEATTDNWWNRNLMNRAKKLAQAKENYDTLFKGISIAEEKAEEMYEIRRSNASLLEQIAYMKKVGEIICSALQKKSAETETRLQILEDSRSTFQSELEEAQDLLKELDGQIEEAVNDLKSLNADLEGASQEEIAAKQGIISEKEIELENLRSQQREQLSIHNTVEGLLVNIVGQIKSTKVTLSTAKANEAGLRRLVAGQEILSLGWEQQIRSSVTLNVGSNMMKSGKEVTMNIFKQNFEMMAMARKQFADFLASHKPEMMQKFAIHDAIREEQRKYVQDLQNYLDEAEEGYASEPKKKKVVRPSENNVKK